MLSACTLRLVCTNFSHLDFFAPCPVCSCIQERGSTCRLWSSHVDSCRVWCCVAAGAGMRCCTVADAGKRSRMRCCVVTDAGTKSRMRCCVVAVAVAGTDPKRDAVLLLVLHLVLCCCWCLDEMLCCCLCREEMPVLLLCPVDCWNCGVSGMGVSTKLGLQYVQCVIMCCHADVCGC